MVWPQRKPSNRPVGCTTSLMCGVLDPILGEAKFVLCHQDLVVGPRPSPPVILGCMTGHDFAEGLVGLFGDGENG